MSVEVQNRELQMYVFSTSKAKQQSRKHKKRKNDILFQILSLDSLTLETFLTHFEQKAFILEAKKKEKLVSFTIKTTFLQNLPNFCVRN
jgi:hypothetical protein